MQRESAQYDVIIVGAGPAGLSAAIQLKQLAKKQGKTLEVCVLEKAAEVGGHLLSGAVLETKSLDELIPDWKAQGAPLETPVTKDYFLYFTSKNAYPLPVPPSMKNHGNYIISLGQFCRWLGKYAQTLGVDIFPGFSGSHLLFNEKDEVCGIGTADMGIDKKGEPKSTYTPGMDLYAKYVMIAEGCRGSLTRELENRFQLRSPEQIQTYGIGIKEVWEITPTQHQSGTVVHTIGWPLDQKTYGGSFLYHWGKNLLSIGFVVGLDYENPYMDPFEEMQRFKLHPHIRPLLEGATRIGYGARAISEGGFQSIPTLAFPGGILIGDCAGFLNVPKIKGIHTAMKSGMEGAKSVFHAFMENGTSTLQSYENNLQHSWLWPELKKVRNIRPGFQKGLWAGLLYAAADTYLFRGHTPWTFKHHGDHQALKPAKNYSPIAYPKPDKKITFDKSSSVYLCNITQDENQPCHLEVKNMDQIISINHRLYKNPETRYCPAQVYEILKDASQKPYLHINAQNCIHCKTCDIKDPTQNIRWNPPEGGSGPNYGDM